MVLSQYIIDWIISRCCQSFHVLSFDSLSNFPSTPLFHASISPQSLILQGRKGLSRWRTMSIPSRFPIRTRRKGEFCPLRNPFRNAISLTIAIYAWFRFFWTDFSNSYTLYANQISPTVFSETINDVNVLLIRANDPLWACFDNVFDVLTLYIGGLIAGSRYKRVSRLGQWWFSKSSFFDPVE